MSSALLTVTEAAAETTEKTFSMNGPLVVASFDLFGITWNLTESVIVQWIVILILFALMLILTHKLEIIPKTKRQAAAEWIVTFVIDMVDSAMGPKYKAYRAYMGAVLFFLMLNNLMGLLGLRNPTADVSVTGAVALITFSLTQYNRAKTGKLKGFLASFAQPAPFMLPFNIISEVANPVSQALRLFGNILGGTVISGLIYFALGNFAIVIPAVASLYFDIFSAVIQSYIFVMLSMTYISGAEC